MVKLTLKVAVGLSQGVVEEQQEGQQFSKRQGSLISRRQRNGMKLEEEEKEILILEISLSPHP